eukprot:CAMPEP_0206183374 /NCGR_PEP_ID=MMETSP0166-20121206/600_1 /ASSEMBLY_ACC=CAM_ASM_000260 /TAXON_ID=95228 /ORGANISM="Vannella robusta, Strain DIVA3 518/3/11/1/6" /LENGTH=113 /DNA_ID=CAMNT_0053598217 /DNA_START=559 /DNA_END=897 /DNA_ORIENTATION=-
MQDIEIGKQDFEEHLKDRSKGKILSSKSVAPIPKDFAVSAPVNQFKNAISRIIEAKEAAKSQEKKVAIVEKYIDSHLFHLAAIGGVHSNTVYRRLIKAVDAPLTPKKKEKLSR